MPLDHRLIVDPTAPIGHLSVPDRRRVCELRTSYALAAAREVGKACAVPEQVASLLGPRIVGAVVEHLYVVLLDARQRLCCEPILVHKGTQDGCDVDPRAILRQALAQPLCQNVVIAHNHPSGDPDASAADHAVTKLTATACRSVMLSLVDHVIVCSASVFTSLRRSDPQLFR